MKHLEVILAPGEFAELRKRDLSTSICVVFDVLRATSSMVSALGNGAGAILPVEDIPEALKERNENPAVLLAGERNGLRIEGRLTGGVCFDLGNSPREFTEAKVRGKRIVWTTTNGTRALRACIGARAVLVGSLLNLAATAEALRCMTERGAQELPQKSTKATEHRSRQQTRGVQLNRRDAIGRREEVSEKSSQTASELGYRSTEEWSPEARELNSILIVCSGTYQEVAFEDVLGAGAFCDLICDQIREGGVSDSALIARKLWNWERKDLLGAISKSKNGRRLLGRAELADDVAFCARKDVFDFAVEMGRDGWLRRMEVE